jgi:hypothetical protein
MTIKYFSSLIKLIDGAHTLKVLMLPCGIISTLKTAKGSTYVSS